MLSNGRGKGARYLCTSTGTLWDVGMESLAAMMCQFMCSWCSVRVSCISHCSMPCGSWIP